MNLFNHHKKRIMMTASLILIIVLALSVLYKTNTTFAENILGAIVTPCQNAISSVGRWFKDKATYFDEITELKEENEALKAQVQALEEENSRLQYYGEENKRLTAFFEMNQLYEEHPMIGARVIAKDTGNWYNSFIIDKGTNDGIHPNMIVLAEGGLVGKVIESGNQYAKVVSVLDDTSSFSAICARTQDLGVVGGEYALRSQSLCRMDKIDMNASIVEGDEITTSHISGYPSGIRIGSVTEVGVDNNGITKYAIIEPHVDFKHLDMVMVITLDYIDPSQ